jgi:hypothetical protein
MQHDRLCFVAGGEDAERARLQVVLRDAVPVADRAELEVLLGRMLDARGHARPKTLDLVGYATTSKLLSIGGWTIDGEDRAVLAFFRGLAEQEVLPRLGVHSLRLIGSLTGATPAGMLALRALARVLGVRVFGATELIYARHFDQTGFIADGALVSSDDDPTSTPPYAPTLEPRHELVVDALPARPLVAGERISIASRDDAHALLGVIARTAGVAMPGLLAVVRARAAEHRAQRVPSARAPVRRQLRARVSRRAVRARRRVSGARSARRARDLQGRCPLRQLERRNRV